MKDKEARDSIRGIKRSIEHLTRLVVRDCPKCKHETVQSMELKTPHSSRYLLPYEPREPDWDYLCLVCGSKLKCVTLTKCEVVK